MEPEASISRSQEPATCPYPKPHPCSPHPTFLQYFPSGSILIRLTYLRLGLPSGLSRSGFPTNTPWVPILPVVRAVSSGNAILLGLITRIILVYRPWSSSMYSLLQHRLYILLKYYTAPHNCIFHKPQFNEQIWPLNHCGQVAVWGNVVRTRQGSAKLINTTCNQ